MILTHSHKHKCYYGNLHIIPMYMCKFEHIFVHDTKKYKAVNTNFMRKLNILSTFLTKYPRAKLLPTRSIMTITRMTINVYHITTRSYHNVSSHNNASLHPRKSQHHITAWGTTWYHSIICITHSMTTWVTTSITQHAITACHNIIS